MMKFLSDIYEKKLILVFVLSLLFAIKLYFSEFLPIYDGGWYFGELIKQAQGYTYRLGGIFNFNLIGHPCMTYFFPIGLLIKLGLNPDTSLFFVNFIFQSVGIFYFYKVILVLNPQTTRRNLFLTISFFAFNPLYLALSFGANPDFAVISIYPGLIYGFLSKNRTNTIFFILLISFTKEIGLLMGLLTTILFAIYENKYKFSFKVLLTYLFFISLFILSYILFKTKYTGLDYTKQTNTLKEFYFSQENLFKKLIQLFIFPGHWILIIGFLFSLKKIKSGDPHLVFVSAFTGFLFFSLFYITWRHPRYNSIAILFHSLLLFYSLPHIKAIFSWALVSFALLQNFFTFDPMAFMLNKVPYFKNKLHEIGYNYLFIVGEGQTDATLYNLQHYYPILLFNKLIKDNPDSTYLISSTTNLNRGWINWEIPITGSTFPWSKTDCYVLVYHKTKNKLSYDIQTGKPIHAVYTYKELQSNTNHLYSLEPNWILNWQLEPEIKNNFEEISSGYKEYHYMGYKLIRREWKRKSI